MNYNADSRLFNVTETALILQYPDADSDIAFVVVNKDGSANPLHSKKNADDLTKALEIGNVDDPQARLLIDIYRKGIVTKGNAAVLGSLVSALDPCEDLTSSLIDAADEGRTTDEESMALTSSIYDIHNTEILIANTDGLMANEVREDGTMDLLIGDMPYLESAYGSGSREVEVARQLGANAFAHQLLVSWKPTQDALFQPVIHDAFETVTVGQKVGGAFMPIASVIPKQPE